VHKRILRAILLAVTVTGFALGVPLAYTTALLVSGAVHWDVRERIDSVATRIVNHLANDGKITSEQLRIGLLSDDHLRVRLADGTELVSGPDPGPDPVREEVRLIPQGDVELTIPSEPMRQKQLWSAGFVLLLMVLSVGTGAVVATVTSRRLAEPLQYVAKRAGMLGGGDFRPDLRRHGVHELDRLAEALDTSASAIAQLVTRERQLVGDLSHQLRSRLTALRLRLEAISAHPEQEIATEAVQALEQADRLAEVFEELLASARAARSFGAEPIDLSSHLPAIAREWRQQFRAQRRTLRLKVPVGLMARATPARLSEAIGVLLDNALRHGAGTVTVTARGGEATVVIEVSDDGPGVPDELTGHIFERGVSGHGSTGVGLALARALADADGGRLELATAKPATFALFLPVPKADTVQAGTGWRSPGGPR